MAELTYELSELMGTARWTVSGEPKESDWCDEDRMLAHLLLNDVAWTREAFTIINKDSQYEHSHDGLTAYVNCNDLFFWGCADAEPLRHEDIKEVFLMWHNDRKWGVLKWCCAKRNVQPQRPIRRDMVKDGAWDDAMAGLPKNPDDKEPTP